MWTGGGGLLGRVVSQGHTAPKRYAKLDVGFFASQSYPYLLSAFWRFLYDIAGKGSLASPILSALT